MEARNWKVDTSKLHAILNNKCKINQGVTGTAQRFARYFKMETRNWKVDTAMRTSIF